jgi:preprotein translocase subunit SecD
MDKRPRLTHVGRTVLPMKLAASLCLIFCMFFSGVALADAPLEIRLVVAPGTPGAVKLPWGEDEAVYCAKEPLLDHKSVAEAAVLSIGAKEPRWEVEVRFNERGKVAFAKATTDHAGGQLGVLSNGKLFVVARVVSPITGGTLRISGNLTKEEATDLAAVIQAAVPKPATP